MATLPAAPPAPPAPTPPDPPRPGRSTHVLAVVVFALAGLLLAASAITAQGTDLRAGRASEARDLVARAAQRVAQSEAEVAALRAEVDALTAEQGISAELVRAQAETARLLPVAGLTEVVGPGITVSLDDSDADPADLPGNPGPNDLVVHQQDVQAVVNALWRGGASAVQVMDQRIVSTSAVRCVGNTLILQGRVYSPPFTVTAVGDLAAMGRSLDADPQIAVYREYVDVYGLGWSVDTADQVTIPAYTGPVLPAYATVPERT
jgi:uncharacterized protein YlxW (UPF0749 family)